MKAAVTHARLDNYAASLGHLDEVVSEERAEALARDLISEWTRLKPTNRATTNISSSTRGFARLEEGMLVSAFHNVAAHKLAEDGPIDCDVLVFGDDKVGRWPNQWRPKR